MKTENTKAIVLARIDYGEADRIITFLTPDQGKLRLMAKGVRKVKSKLAGGIELFSTSDVTFIRGKRDIGTLVSVRMERHYGRIIKDLDRVQTGYELIKLLNRATEDEPEPEYYDLLETAFRSLDDAAVDIRLIQVWFTAQLLKLSGHRPNLASEVSGRELAADKAYNFDYDSVAFAAHPEGIYDSARIKTLRLIFSDNPPAKLVAVGGINDYLSDIAPLINSLKNNYLNV